VSIVATEQAGDAAKQAQQAAPSDQLKTAVQGLVLAAAQRAVD
jgi:hypothetical protein